MGLGSYWHLPLSLSVAAVLSGCVLAPKESAAERHRMEHEVKAITYHGLRLENTPAGWFAEVIVDI